MRSKEEVKKYLEYTKQDIDEYYNYVKYSEMLEEMGDLEEGQTREELLKILKEIKNEK